MIIYGNNSKISPLSLPFQVPFFFFSFSQSSTTADSFPFICLFFSFFENFRQKGQGDIEFFVVVMLMGCLAFGSREFSFFHIPVHAWSSSSCYFLVGPLLESGVLKKILSLFVIWHQHQFGFKRLLSFLEPLCHSGFKDFLKCNEKQASDQMICRDGD